ncbi:MAG: hypothetical protein Q4F65_02415 [Propionibacteriaceae bacterium]|nr:hypothetical protein [Propionibacteriaceae bacterium]
MKTAISVPEDVFDRATRLAERHGLNRSQFYTAAARHYADHLESEELTAAIDAALVGTGEDDSTRFAASAGRALLARENESW